MMSCLPVSKLYVCLSTSVLCSNHLLKEKLPRDSVSTSGEQDQLPNALENKTLLRDDVLLSGDLSMTICIPVFTPATRRKIAPRRHIVVRLKPKIYGDKHCCEMIHQDPNCFETTDRCPATEVLEPVAWKYSYRTQFLRWRVDVSRNDHGQHIAALLFLPRITIKIWPNFFEVQTRFLPLNIYAGGEPIYCSKLSRPFLRTLVIDNPKYSGLEKLKTRHCGPEMRLRKEDDFLDRNIKSTLGNEISRGRYSVVRVFHRIAPSLWCIQTPNEDSRAKRREDGVVFLRKLWFVARIAGSPRPMRLLYEI
ncbi:hypothetical protein IW262DRAFT_1299260 [Armillaria fumosa]|nr:hypothetical protein IW262DRAFT_1299260 [Armillaria fumosa]